MFICYILSCCKPSDSHLDSTLSSMGAQYVFMRINCNLLKWFFNFDVASNTAHIYISIKRRTRNDGLEMIRPQIGAPLHR